MARRMAEPHRERDTGAVEGNKVRWGCQAWVQTGRAIAKAARTDGSR